VVNVGEKKAGNPFKKYSTMNVKLNYVTLITNKSVCFIQTDSCKQRGNIMCGLFGLPNDKT
jgi:hypothetical protein